MTDRRKKVMGPFQGSRRLCPIEPVGDFARRLTKMSTMFVTVDHEPLEIQELGLMTVGQVLSHVQRENRLVVNLLIDGEEPDLDTLGTVKRSPLAGHTLFIE